MGRGSFGVMGVALIDIRVMKGHEVRWVCQRLEAELGIETMSIPRREQEAS